MKFIVKHGKSEKDIRNLRQEIEILRQLKHENIIQMLDAFETKTDFCVVTGGCTHVQAGRAGCCRWRPRACRSRQQRPTGRPLPTSMPRGSVSGSSCPGTQLTRAPAS